MSKRSKEITDYLPLRTQIASILHNVKNRVKDETSKGIEVVRYALPMSLVKVPGVSESDVATIVISELIMKLEKEGYEVWLDRNGKLWDLVIRWHLFIDPGEMDARRNVLTNHIINGRT
jgi:hypothetical protein